VAKVKRYRAGTDGQTTSGVHLFLQYVYGA